MKLSTNHLLAKIKGASPDQASTGLLLILVGCVGIVPLILFLVLGKIAISPDSVALATIVGGIAGPVLTFFTLGFVLLNFQSDGKDKNFRQALDFTERLLKLYTESVNKYESEGRKVQRYNEKMEIVVGNIVPYIRATEPLFATVMLHLQASYFTKLQYAGLLGIIEGQLRPLIVVMTEEMEHLDRNMELEYNQIAHRQLATVDRLLLAAQR